MSPGHKSQPHTYTPRLQADDPFATSPPATARHAAISFQCFLHKRILRHLPGSDHQNFSHATVWAKFHATTKLAVQIFGTARLFGTALIALPATVVVLLTKNKHTRFRAGASYIATSG